MYESRAEVSGLVPDELEDACEVGPDLLHGLAQQPSVGSHPHIGHPVHGHQGLQQAAQRVQGGLARLGRGAAGDGR